MSQPPPPMDGQDGTTTSEPVECDSTVEECPLISPPPQEGGEGGQGGQGGKGGKPPMKPLHMALILAGPTLDILAGAYNYNTWNADASVADWSSTYKIELISGVAQLSLAATHLFVKDMVGMYLGPV